MLCLAHFAMMEPASEYKRDLQHRGFMEQMPERMSHVSGLQRFFSAPTLDAEERFDAWLSGLKLKPNK
jgi:Cu/Ag efflux pump CusA